MTAALYSRLATTAKKLLTSYGKSTIVLARQTGTTYNTTSGAVTGTTTNYPVAAQVFDYSDERIGRSGGLIRVGDRRVLIAAVDLSFDPDPTTDRLVIGGVSWSIVKVGKPVDEQVLYDIQIRRA